MKKKVINWMWENEEAQRAYSDWRGFPSKEETAIEVDKMNEIIKLNTDSNILDIPCGSGRHSLEFAQRGYKVTGVDIAATYIEEARKNAINDNVKVDFRYQRAFHIREKEKFDLILSYNHALGFIKEGNLGEHFLEIRNALRDGGKFLLKIRDEIINENLTEEHMKTWGMKNGKYILSEKYLEDGHRVENCIFIDPKKKEIIECSGREKCLSHENIKAILKASGFAKINCYSDINGMDADDENFGLYICEK